MPRRTTANPFSVEACSRLLRLAEKRQAAQASLGELINQRKSLEEQIGEEPECNQKRMELADDLVTTNKKIERCRADLKWYGDQLALTTIKANQGVLFRDVDPEPDNDADAPLFQEGADAAGKGDGEEGDGEEGKSDDKPRRGRRAAAAT